MAGRPVRIEIRGLATERERAQRDLRETLGALEEKLLPQRAVRRFVRRRNPVLVVAGLVAAGVAVGLLRDENPAVRTAGLVAAATAGLIVVRLATR
jgi:hypothetical protein